MSLILTLSSRLVKCRYNPSPFLRLLELANSNFILMRYVFKNRKQIDVVYAREPFVLPVIWFSKYVLKKPIFFEAHAVLHRRRSQWLIERFVRMADGVVSITRAMENFYRKYNSNIITSYCSAVDPNLFAIKKDKKTLRQELHLPEDKIIIGYTGNMGVTGNNDSYGIDDIVKAIPLLDNRFVFIGVGKKEDETAGVETLADDLNVSDRALFFAMGRSSDSWRVHPFI